MQLYGQLLKLTKFVIKKYTLFIIILAPANRYQYTMKRLNTYTDDRGSLTVLEGGIDVPFDIARVYWIYGVNPHKERGKHANRSSKQFLVAINGSVEVTLENLEGRQTYHLNSRTEGLLIPPGTWNELSNFSDDAILMVFSSQPYRPETYLNTYEEFQEFIHQNK